MTIRLAEETRDAAGLQSRRDARPVPRDEAAAAVTNGAPAGTSGALGRGFLGAYVGLSVFVLACCTVNVLSVLHDAPRLRPIEPVIWEYSSALATIVLLPGVALLAARAPFERARLGRFLLVHAAASVAYSLLHVGGFVLLRTLAYAAAGHQYHFEVPDELIYEYRKDALSYVIALSVFSFAGRLGERRGPSAGASTTGDDPMFDIKDGARIIRTPVGEIVAARSAGNYVEIHLADGRRPLMRATLAGVEASLAPHGFLRTHRSWLVNPRRVRALEPEGSGDWRVELEGGAEAPLSRRFPQALEALRRPA